MVVSYVASNSFVRGSPNPSWGYRAEGEIARNHVLSRGFIEGLGVMPWRMALAERLSRINFRIGILSTTVFLGIGTTLANNWFTNKKLLAEQQQLASKPSSSALAPFQGMPPVLNRDPFVQGAARQAPDLQYAVPV